MKSDQARIAEEERRKTLNEETKHARAVSVRFVRYFCIKYIPSFTSQHISYIWIYCHPI